MRLIGEATTFDSVRHKVLCKLVGKYNLLRYENTPELILEINPPAYNRN